VKSPDHRGFLVVAAAAGEGRRSRCTSQAREPPPSYPRRGVDSSCGDQRAEPRDYRALRPGRRTTPLATATLSSRRPEW
jgi:hypothetical protein